MTRVESRLPVVTGCSTTALARQRPPLPTTKHRGRKRPEGVGSTTRTHALAPRGGRGFHDARPFALAVRSTRATDRVASVGGVHSGGVGPPRPVRSPKGCESGERVTQSERTPPTDDGPRAPRAPR